MLSQRQVEKPCNELRTGEKGGRRRRELLDKLSQNSMFHRMSCKRGKRGWGCITGEQRRGGEVTSGLVQPLCSFRGLACVYVHGFLTVLTLHSTAPFELALALGDLLHSGGVIATPTAHDLTAICTT